MSSYNVGFQELKFLVDGFEAYGCTRKRAVEWLKENKKDLTPEFMASVKANPEGFFYYETHIRPDEEFEFSDLEEMSEVS